MRFRRGIGPILFGGATACFLGVSLSIGAVRELALPDGLIPLIEPIPEATDYIRGRAEDAVRGRFTFQGVTGDALNPATGRIDWGHRGPRDDPEWAWLLNRHHDFVHLVSAWQDTHDPRYLRAMDQQVCDWLDSNPVPSRFSVSPGWRALEAARRVVNSWIPVLVSLRAEPAFPAETRARMVDSLVDHARYLMQHHHFGGNHLVTEMSALLLLAVVLPDHPESMEWAGYAVERLRQELDRQILPDGVHRELSNHYQLIAGEAFQRAQDLSVLIPGATGPALSPGRLEAIWDYFARVTRPNGTGPLNNDADLEFNGLRIKPLADRYDRPDWAWIATQGNRGSPPPGPPGSWYPYAGHLIFRDNWGQDALWGFFDLGPHGSDHQQEDRLHLSVSVGSEDFLVDAGRYVYRDDRWSAWFRSGAAHNRIRLDRTEPLLPGRTLPKADYGAAFVSEKWILGAGTNRFPAPALGRGGRRHHRAVAFHPAGGWVVVDAIFGFGIIEVEQRWRYHPKVSLKIEGGRVEASRSRHRLWQIPIAGPAWDVEIVSGREEPTIEGWYSPQYNQKLPNPVWIGRARVSGPTVWVWWFCPEHLDTAVPPKWDGRQLHWDPDGSGGLVLELETSASSRKAGASLGEFRYGLANQDPDF